MSETETPGEEVKSQLNDIFGAANFPVNSPMDLVPALPNGINTRITVKDSEWTAVKLQTKLSADFPHDSLEDLVNHILGQLILEGHLDEDEFESSTVEELEEGGYLD